jgi:branched-chain amino acid transport system ATP-binding protein
MSDATTHPAGAPATPPKTHPLVDGEVGPGCRKVDPILVADDVVRQFGGLTAVDVAHVEVPRGMITALIGPNGAGKTTLFNLLTGFDRPNKGKWSFESQSLAHVPSHKVARRGMVRTFQLTKSLGRLTVLQNMLLGARDQRGEGIFAALVRPLWAAQEKANTERADKLLARFKLDEKREDYAASLSGGQRKLLEMARALMSEPTLVMLDEPMAGVNPALTQSLLDHVRGLKADGMTVLFVEHDMHMVRHISDWVIVMAEGKIVAEGPPETIMHDQAVIDAYLGAHHDTDLGTLTNQQVAQIHDKAAEEAGLDVDDLEAAQATGTSTDAQGHGATAVTTDASGRPASDADDQEGQR